MNGVMWTVCFALISVYWLQWGFSRQKGWIQKSRLLWGSWELPCLIALPPNWPNFEKWRGAYPLGTLVNLFYELCGSSSFWVRQGARRFGLGREPSALWSSEPSDHQHSFRVENLLLLRLRDIIPLYCSHKKGVQVHLLGKYEFSTWPMNGWLIP